MNKRVCRFGQLPWLFVWMLALVVAFVPAAAFAQEVSQIEGEQAPEEVTLEEVGQPGITATIDIAGISKYGNVELSVSCDELREAFAYGDVVTVSFLGQSYDLPFCSNFSDVDSGEAGLFARADKDYSQLAINMGDFATTYGIATKTVNEDKSFYWTVAEGAEEPVEVTITLKEAGGYYEQYVMHQLSYTNAREDYPQLSDDEFANFREVATTGMGTGILYRCSSPVNSAGNRNTYADAALARVGVNAIVNLTDTEDELAGFEGYDQSYYATVDHVALSMSMDMQSEENRAKLAEGLRFMAQTPGIYAIHCLEGKDRTGFVIAVLECLMGASKDEVIEDYMITFYNYYGVTADDERYDVIANSNIVKSLQRAFGVESLDEENLAALAEGYLLDIGLTVDELSALKANLNPQTTITVSFEMGGHGCAPADQELVAGECAVRPKDPVALGFTFVGWYVDGACTQEFDFATPLEQDTTIYAKWDKVVCPRPVVVHPIPGRPGACVGGRPMPCLVGRLNPWCVARSTYMPVPRAVVLSPCHWYCRM